MKKHASPNIQKISAIHSTIDWHTLSGADIFEQLKTSLTLGLNSDEVSRRQNIYGLNQLVEKKRRSFLAMLVDQINNFLIILLIIAAVVSWLLGDRVEAIAILAIVVLNTVMGIVQEGRAEQALAALKKLAAPEAQVLRDGHRRNIPAVQLVPGDIVFLETGFFTPADIRLIETINLSIDEASLTGESHPASKDANVIVEKEAELGDRNNLAFMGTTVTYGRGKGVIVTTGMETQLGKIASMLQSVEEESTPLQKNLDKLAKLLGIGALLIVALVFIISVIRITSGFENLIDAFSNTNSLELIKNSFMIAVSLAIAAVPEGLAAVVTISLALGMREMVRRNALIRRLSAVETLGSATIICSDKTGTLTQNEMTVTRYWVDSRFFNITGSGYSNEGEVLLDGQKIDLNNYPAVKTALWVGVLNNDAQLEATSNQNGKTTYRIVGDPTEGSIIVVAAKTGASPEDIIKAYPRFNEIPFDSTRKRMVTIHAIHAPRSNDISPITDESTRGYAITMKGAPDVVLDHCTHYLGTGNEVKPMDSNIQRRILDAIETMSDEALRVLGMAYRMTPEMPKTITEKELEKDLIFAGLVGMIDPAREEVRPALDQARRAGIRTIMITGDYPNTARAIAEDINLLQPNRRLLTGKQLNALDETALKEEILYTDVFARVSPEHKMRIVSALRSHGEVVAMTGDGVNDAPAIKSADIGIAMGITGTDVAKETADMVLTDDNYASIVGAIEQGRIIYSNIRKFVYYLLSCNMAEIAIIFLATLFNLPSPLTALQLLWLNLMTDGAPALALATEKGDPDIMDQPPRPPKEPIVNRYMRVGIVVQTIAIAATTLIAYFTGLSDPTHHLYAQTMAFTTLSISELFRAYTARSEFYPLLRIGMFTNRTMNIAVIVSLILILMVIYVPFLRPAFGTEPLGWLQWIEIIPLMLIPSIIAEVSKYLAGVQRKQNNN